MALNWLKRMQSCLEALVRSLGLYYGKLWPFQNVKFEPNEIFKNLQQYIVKMFSQYLTWNCFTSYNNHCLIPCTELA